ncbi:MAG: nucleotidyltransferase domain-containing protein [Bacteroidota bacterium]
MKNEIILSKIKKAVQSVDEKAKVILFGSRARGDYQSDSDWDLLILPREKVSYELEDQFRELIYDLELEYEQVFSIFLFPLSKWMAGASPSPLYDNIREEGVMI